MTSKQEEILIEAIQGIGKSVSLIAQTFDRIDDMLAAIAGLLAQDDEDEAP